MNYSEKLNEFDILDLLNEYQSEMRKLKHKVAFVKAKISELEALYNTIKQRKAKNNVDKAATSSLNVHVSGTNASEDLPAKKSSVFSNSKKAPKGKAKAKTVKIGAKSGKKLGRKLQALSTWDSMIVDSIIENGQPTLSRDIFTKIREKAISKGLFESDDATKVKLNQCLVKLTSRRSDLVKVNHPGRGFAYALPEWTEKKGV